MNSVMNNNFMKVLNWMKVKNLIFHIPYHWLLRGLSQAGASQYLLFSQLTVLDTVEKPLSKHFPLLLRTISRLIYQLLWKISGPFCLKKLPESFH